MKTTKGGKVMNPTDAFRKEQRKKELKRVSSSSQTLGFVSCYHPARAGPGPCGGGVVEFGLGQRRVVMFLMLR